MDLLGSLVETQIPISGVDVAGRFEGLTDEQWQMMEEFFPETTRRRRFRIRRQMMIVGTGREALRKVLRDWYRFGRIKGQNSSFGAKRVLAWYDVSLGPQLIEFK